MAANKDSIRRLDIGLLGPGAASARQDIDRAAVVGAVVGLNAIDTRGVAVFTISPDRQGVAVGR